MNVVEPIRDMNLVKDIASYLRQTSERNYIMFIFGIYSGLRISDILQFRVRDVRGLDYIRMKEKKTGKDKRFPINAELKKELKKYIADKEDYELLFPSKSNKYKAITRQQAYNILSDVGNKYGLNSMGTHTLRKTFGYHMYQMTHDAALIMDILNHSNIDITLRYIGINQDTKDDAYKKLSFKI